MTDSARVFTSSGWRDVDATGDAEFYVRYLDRAATGPLRAARREIINALDVRPDSSVLDVGSGVGEFLIELAEAVPGVRAVGIDASETLVSTAKSRAEAAGVAVQFSVGDAEHLDFPDGSFDRVHCSRVLQHLDHPEMAVREMARVLSRGGRAAIIEPDFDTLMVDSDDLATSTAVRKQAISGMRNPDMGRRLRRLLLDAGLTVPDLIAQALGPPNLAIAKAQFGLFDYLDAAVAAGDVSAEAAAAWREWLEASDARGYLFVASVAVRVVAEKAM
jgi:SAM-dependent methyltransferase